ncbi:hypothetical protein EDB86DRAFT_2898420 [Lactarius hatsudake]|nr:hypothetical protein EDB86DRAFT_2898420 [Lactarius hatsudake]
MAHLVHGKSRPQGKIGGYTEFAAFYDSSRTLLTYVSMSVVVFPRGVLNEGGFRVFGERAGWHLFDTRNWVARDFSAGLPNGNAGVGFVSTVFPLHIPVGFDVMQSFTFDESAHPYRALLFVHGWMMGKRMANLGLELEKVRVLITTSVCIALNSSSSYPGLQ